MIEEEVEDVDGNGGFVTDDDDDDDDGTDDVDDDEGNVVVALGLSVLAFVVFVVNNKVMV